MAMHDVQSDQGHDGAQPRAVRTTRRELRRQRREGDELDLESATSELGLPPAAGRYVTYRVLPYARFCEDQANISRLVYYWLRIPAITLAAVVPALIAANLGVGARWVATGLGIVVAATTGTEHFSTSAPGGVVNGQPKRETWNYLELAGPYATFPTHDAGLQTFVTQAEQMLREDWTAYVTIVNTETKDHAEAQTRGAATSV